MKTVIVVACFMGFISTGSSRESVAQTSPFIEAAMAALPPRHLDQYKAARSRIEGDYGHAVKVFFANTFIPNDITRMGLELDFADALLEPVEKRLNVKVRSYAVLPTRMLRVPMAEHRRRIKDSETVLLLLKGRVQNVPTIWTEIEERLEKIAALKARVGE